MYRTKKLHSPTCKRPEYVIIQISAADDGSVVLQKHDRAKVWKLPADIVGSSGKPFVAACSCLKRLGIQNIKNQRLELIRSTVREFNGVCSTVYVFRCIVDRNTINALEGRSGRDRTTRVFRRKEVHMYLTTRDFKLAFS